MNTDKNGESPFITLLKKELVVAMGCTEPAAAALAGATARSALGEEPTRVLIRASREIIKNAMHAGIPHTDLKGIRAAVALGIAGGETSRGLNILSGIEPGVEQRAREYLDSGKMELELVEGAPPVFVEVRLDAGTRRIAARILHEHSHAEVLEASEFEKKETFPVEAPAASGPQLDLPLIYDFAARVPLEDIDFLVDGAKTNLELAQYSMEAGYGIRVGKITLESYGDASPIVDYLFRQGASVAAAASDARMAGCPMPVVINSGSGNQGITVSVPVLVMAEGLGRSREETARALCLAHLTALMMTSRKDRLSALCGAFTAAIGTAAGYISLLGGTYTKTEHCINIMIANLIGLLCDGAKGSCALKIYSCVEAAALAVKLAMAGSSVPAAEGILDYTLDETLLAVQKISHEGMIPLDKTVLSLMMNKTQGNAE